MTTANLSNLDQDKDVNSIKPPRISWGQSNRRVIVIETWVVVVVGVVPHLFSAFVAANRPDWFAISSFIVDSLYSIVRNASIIAPVLYIMWRCGETWDYFGIVKFNWKRDIPLGICTWLTGMIGIVISYELVLYWIRDSGNRLVGPKDGAEYMVLFLFAAVNGFGEELVIRGYLIPRLERIWGSALLAIAATSLLFASYHIYQGLLGALFIFVGGVIYGIVFCVTRRLWPVVIAPAIADVFPYIIPR